MSSNFAERPEAGASSQALTPPPGYSVFKTAFASLSLHQSDQIRLLQFPQSDIDSLRAVIKATYSLGIQEERIYGESYEFKLRGHPWTGRGNEVIPSRILMREILAHLFQSGWIFHASTDCSKRRFDKDTLVFRKQHSLPPESEWIAICFEHSDTLRVVGADEFLTSAVRELLQSMKLLQVESWKDRRLGAKDFKMHGRLWVPNGEETMKMRLLLLKLLECLESHGLSLYATIDQCSSGANKQNVTDSWYCVRDKAWFPGNQVFHR